MSRICLSVAVVVAFFSGAGSPKADDKAARAIVDKAIEAVGGEARLSKAQAIEWKAKGKLRFGENENEFTSHVTYQGLDRHRSEFEGDFGGNRVKGVTVVNGDKGWRKFGDFNMPMDADTLANARRTIYLATIPVTLVALKGKEFKLETTDDDKVGDKPAAGLKVTGPDDREFRLYFDKESGLPVRVVAKVAGFMGDEFLQETTYSEFKEIDGLKRATRVESKRDGEPFVVQEISEFKTLEKPDPKVFAEPE